MCHKENKIEIFENVFCMCQKFLKMYFVCAGKPKTLNRTACLLMLMIWTGFDELNCAA